MFFCKVGALSIQDHQPQMCAPLYVCLPILFVDFSPSESDPLAL
jgi:hypothetical protein